MRELSVFSIEPTARGLNPSPGMIFPFSNGSYWNPKPLGDWLAAKSLIFFIQGFEPKI